jgi:hypothetical protein
MHAKSQAVEVFWFIDARKNCNWRRLWAGRRKNVPTFSTRSVLVAYIGPRSLGSSPSQGVQIDGAFAFKWRRYWKIKHSSGTWRCPCFRLWVGCLLFALPKLRMRGAWPPRLHSHSWWGGQLVKHRHNPTACRSLMSVRANGLISASTLRDLPIMLDMNLLRSVGGIQRAVMGWIAGHDAPCKGNTHASNCHSKPPVGHTLIQSNFLYVTDAH